MFVEYCELRYMFKKIARHRIKLAHMLDKVTASKFALFSVSGLKDETFIQKQTYTLN